MPKTVRKRGPPPQTKCKRCRHDFKDKTSYQRHQITQKTECVGFFYTCKRCLKPFDNLETLRKHQVKGETECPDYKFENKIEAHNRIVTHYNIGNEGFKQYIRKILTPVVIDSETEETKLNFKLIKLVFDSLSVSEFVEMIKYVCDECSDLKFYLLASLKFYLDEANDEKADKIKQFFISNRSTSFN